MGLIVHDVVDTTFGIGVTDGYCSFGMARTMIKQISEGVYEVRSRASLWKDLDSRMANASSLKDYMCLIKVKEADLADVYSLMYADLMAKFSSTSPA